MPLGTWIKNALSGTATGIIEPIKDLVLGLTIDPDKKAELAQKLDEISKSHDEKLLELSNDIESKYLADIDSARNREILIASSEKAPLLNKIILPLLAAFVTLGFFGILLFMMLHGIPTANAQVLNIMLGSLGTAWIGIIFYYFGSSMGSAKKSEQLDELMNNKK